MLRHHPDKRRGAGEDIREDDDYFTCITKAFEQVNNHATSSGVRYTGPCYKTTSLASKQHGKKT